VVPPAFTVSIEAALDERYRADPAPLQWRSCKPSLRELPAPKERSAGVDFICCHTVSHQVAALCNGIRLLVSGQRRIYLYLILISIIPDNQARPGVAGQV
jgi:hypothetical protein